MKLKKLSLANYRGFEQIDIEFEDDVTVIAGVNGVGKSGVLEAIATLLSHTLPEFTNSQEAFLNFMDADIKLGKSGLTAHAEFTFIDAAVLVNANVNSPLSAEQVASITKTRDEWRSALTTVKKGSEAAKKFSLALDTTEALLDDKTTSTITNIIASNPENQAKLIANLKRKPRPYLAVFYTTKRFLTKLPTVLRSKKIPESAAHTKALTGVEISLNDFANWYRVQLNDVEEHDSYPAKRIIESLGQAIESFLPNISNLALQEKPRPVFTVDKNGEQLFLWQLSDGEKGLLALVFDLTRRLAIANFNSDNPIQEGFAIVLIDEVELHLHPRWQRDVLDRLKSTFKNCQFIVTTHSPMVLGESQSHSVRFLEYIDGQVQATTPSEAYGMDANRILQELMESPIRSRKIEGMLQELFEVIDDEDFDEARSLMETLEEILGPQEPELTRARTLMKFLEEDE